MLIATSQATYIWDALTEQEKCLYFKSRRKKGTVVTTETGASTYMSTDGTMETSDPQRHQVGTANGQARRGQPGDQDHWASCQERSQTSWRHTRQGRRKCRTKISPGSDADGGGGKATMGTRGDGMEVVRSSAFQRSEDTQE
jgi:hypothetical protein